MLRLKTNQTDHRVRNLLQKIPCFWSSFHNRFLFQFLMLHFWSYIKFFSLINRKKQKCLWKSWFKDEDKVQCPRCKGTKMIYKKTVGCWLCGGVNKVPGAGEVTPEIGEYHRSAKFSSLSSKTCNVRCDTLEQLSPLWLTRNDFSATDGQIRQM